MLLGNFKIHHPDQWLLTTNQDVATAKSKALNNPSLNELHIEEYVRQWVLHSLINDYHYPKEWLGSRLVVEHPVQMGSTVKQADIAIKNERGKPFIFVETKNSSCTEQEFIYAERQLESYLASTHTATIGIVTNGIKHRCLLKKIEPNDFDYISDMPMYNSQGIKQRMKLTREVDASILKGKSKTGLSVINEKLEPILYNVHSAIRAIDGLHDDAALDELCKVIYAKIYDERQIISSQKESVFRFQTFGYGNSEEIASNIRELYSEANEKDIQVYAQRIPNYERSRGVFKEQIKLSSNALCKAVEELQHYSFLDSSGDIKGRAFQKVLSSAIRAGMGQYFTPDPVVRLCVDMLEPTVNDVILDPFCGSGHFLTVCLEKINKDYQNGLIDEYSFHQFKFFHLHGIEKSDRMTRIAMCDMAMQDDGHSNIRNSDSLMSFDNYPDIAAIRGDGNTNPSVFDIIITNPPFGAILEGEVGNIVHHFELGKGKKSLPIEIMGLERCLQFLKPGGKLAILLQDGVLNDSRHSDVRDWIHKQAELVAVISLPEHTFTPYGASPNTSILFLKKHLENNTSQKPVFFAKVESIGYDATGRPKGVPDINEVVETFNKVRGW